MFYCAERVLVASLSRFGRVATSLVAQASQANPAAEILQSLRGHVCLSQLVVARALAAVAARLRSSVGRITPQQGVEEEAWL
jgi:hypothetical protein